MRSLRDDLGAAESLVTLGSLYVDDSRKSTAAASGRLLPEVSADIWGLARVRY